VLLLSSETFWYYFALLRGTNERGERSTLPLSQQQELWHDALDSILIFHSTKGKQDFAAGDYQRAKVHLRCLDLCQKGERQMVLVLEAYDIPYAVELTRYRMQWVSSQAGKLLNDWGGSLLADAEKVVNDGEEIKKLPQGIRKNYRGGIAIVEPFIMLDVPIVRVLVTCLDWYNDLSYDLYLNVGREEMRPVVEQARLIAERLIPFCDQKKTYTPENQALSRYFNYHGYVCVDAILAIKDYQEAMAWSPGYTNAEELLGDARVLAPGQLKQTILVYTEKREFEQAYRTIDEAEQLIDSPHLMQALRVMTCLRHAHWLAGEERYLEALNRSKQACVLNPQSVTAQEFAQVIERCIAAESDASLLKDAEKALARNFFDQALQIVSQIAKDSWVFNQAYQLRITIYYQRGVVSTTRGEFDKAEEHLRYALELDREHKNREMINQQLSNVLTLVATKQIGEMVKTSGSTRGQQLINLIRVYTKSILEEALELDSENENAKMQLDRLNTLLSSRGEKKQ
jgi:tetratricopeptide (TPR) repeat protein